MNKSPSSSTKYQPVRAQAVDDDSSDEKNHPSTHRENDHSMKNKETEAFIVGDHDNDKSVEEEYGEYDMDMDEAAKSTWTVDNNDPVRRSRMLLLCIASLMLLLTTFVASVVVHYKKNQSSSSWATRPLLPTDDSTVLPFPTNKIQKNVEDYESQSPVSVLPHYTWNGKKCFERVEELWSAVDAYLLDPKNTTLEDIYGYPMNAWCVTYLDDFSNTFAFDRPTWMYPNDNPDLQERLSFLLSRFDEDISLWDVSHAKKLNRMFRGCEYFNGDLSRWDVSQVESMHGTFEYMRYFNSDIRNWDVRNVNTFQSMFYQSEKFSRNIVYWNVSGASNLQYMFGSAKSFNHDLCEWGRKLQTVNVNATNGFQQCLEMFMNSGCPVETMVGPFYDDLEHRRPGPFCHACL